jgi:hypothetical protein
MENLKNERSFGWFRELFSGWLLGYFVYENCFDESTFALQRFHYESASKVPFNSESRQGSSKEI